MTARPGARARLQGIATAAETLRQMTGGAAAAAMSSGTAGGTTSGGSGAAPAGSGQGRAAAGRAGMPSTRTAEGTYRLPLRSRLTGVRKPRLSQGPSSWA